MPGTSLSATASALPKYTRTFSWTIDKSVSPNTWNLFTGDSGTSLYTIKVTKGSGIDAAAIYGQICVTNIGDYTTEGLAITVDLEVNPGGGFIPVTLGQHVDVSAKPSLTSKESYCYDYSITIPSLQIEPGKTYKVTAHVTITNHSGESSGPSPSATTDFPLLPTPINNTISVTDTNGKSFTNISETSTMTYEKVFTCSDVGTRKNIATIIYEGNASGPSDDASVTVNCYSLSINKTAFSSYSRLYTWSIDKTVSEDNLSFADTTNIILPAGGIHAAYYKVTVTPTAQDIDFMASGTITISNSTPMGATILGITDTISGVGSVPTTCTGFPFTLAGNGTTISCDYETIPGQLTDKITRTNTATVTIQNYSYHYSLPPTPIGTTSFTDNEDIIFGSTPSKNIDKIISISDDKYGSLGTANADNPSSQTLSYKTQIGPYLDCGNRTVDNTATFTTLDTGGTGSDTAIVNVSVPCGGCTFTIGYWKTHAGFTGNNPDLVTPLLPIWLGTPAGSKSIEVKDASQAVAILSFSGDASNGINKLEAQLLGAKLNINNKADGTIVSTIIAYADGFLATHNSADWTSLTKTQRNQVLSWATTLDNYNNGLIGPGHCSESTTVVTLPEPQDTSCCHCKIDCTTTASTKYSGALWFLLKIAEMF